MYDVIFISYKEPNAEENWKSLVDRFPLSKRIHGVQGIHQAHISAAKLASTKMFWVVDGDAVILDKFNFEFRTKNYDTVHVWRSRNPINDLEYGNGGVKLLPTDMTINMDLSKPDMTTSISEKFMPMKQVSNLTNFNSDPFNTWKSAFRECCKLASKIIDRQKSDETEHRLNVWCTKGMNKTYGTYAIEGAVMGKSYGELTKGSITELKKINDFEWLLSIFKETYE